MRTDGMGMFYDIACTLTRSRPFPLSARGQTSFVIQMISKRMCMVIAAGFYFLMWKLLFVNFCMMSFSSFRGGFFFPVPSRLNQLRFLLPLGSFRLYPLIYVVPTCQEINPDIEKGKRMN
ncbi:hypothetical protein [Phaffia rhodozyma]|uniref:Uncharacterized protein n=1 Tax=Phaffia rhodozyma TaxID=264483 RepID=A0A0F7SH07_PHARH|nr:hypothetical protein [Phaffia rhodozyma]